MDEAFLHLRRLKRCVQAGGQVPEVGLRPTKLVFDEGSQNESSQRSKGPNTGCRRCLEVSCDARVCLCTHSGEKSEVIKEKEKQLV